MSRDALAHNVGVVRRHAPRSRVWAVVKADAYGHGLVRLLAGRCRAFGDADGIAILDTASAAIVRDHGWDRPLLLLEGCFDADDLARSAALGVTVTCHHDAQLTMLEQSSSPGPVDVYLKVNTGMNRLGFAPDEARAVHARLAACGQVGTITWMTHFADADRPDGVAAALAAFDGAANGIDGPRSLANSAAILAHPETHADWVRPGIMLYGATPFATRGAAEFGLVPAMTLASELIAVRCLTPGDAVGYGHRFVADRPMRIGVVACGYADGYPRVAPNGTPVAVDGIVTRTVGRVSMDMLTVDLDGVPGARVGSAVELWGERVPVDDVAQASGTVGYELLCALAPRVPVTAVD